MWDRTAVLIASAALAACASLDDTGEVAPSGQPVAPASSSASAEAPPARDAAAAVADGSGSSVPGPSPIIPSVSETSRTCIEARLAAACDGGLDGGGGTDGASRTPDGLAVDFGTGDLTVLVVFDQSGSMDARWDERTRWEAANDAFERGLDEILDVVTLGAILFPQPSGCSVAPLDSDQQFAFSSGRTFWARWEETAADRVPNGSTPLEQALRAADHAIEQACAHGLLDGRFRVLLVTDGEPTCGDNHQWIVELAAEWKRIGVEIRVLGLPGSNAAASLLNAIAGGGTLEAGGGGALEYEDIQSTSQLDDSVYSGLR
jgi:hypothetical protein